ncbi:hypothetical protein FSARC_5841 [Fusarium sarcochroum]|uniref:Apple domain-containing protein n=1 Tax=Fusarium sarcochroum TaxID=1208366 RepID=A0A8H4X9R4_9HYPO|nr:hypothetical protein FSARC_5841 [Fusarium sarcochroum]
MPSTKVFAAVLAALAVPMVNAGPCKPKPVTTSGSTEAILTTTTGTETVPTTSGSTDLLTTSGTETGTATTETAATTTSGAACTYYTPYTEIVPADCGIKGHAPNCGDKIIGTPIIVKDSAKCGNKCGMTIGCKSFSFNEVSKSCTLYNVLRSGLPFTESDVPGASNFYDLELCFGCGEESSTTTGTTDTETETSATTGTETAATSGTETDTTTGTETETSATSGTETETSSGMTTETNGADTTTGTETTATTVDTTTGTETETATTTGTETETSATSGTETATTTGTETETSSGMTTETNGADTTTGTETTTGADTTTTAATTTTEAACTAYTPVANPPAANCAVKGKGGVGAVIGKLSPVYTVASADECALKCASYVGSEPCKSFSIKDDSCTLYKVVVASLGVTSCEIFEQEEFYDFETCYSCQEGGATTTTTAASETETTTGTETTGTATTGTETTGTATTGTETTGTETATGTATTGTETTATTVDTTTGTETTGTETTTAATTTTDAACTAYTPVANPPAENCAVKGKAGVGASFAYLSSSTDATHVEDCALLCASYVGGDDKCVSFAYKASTGSCKLYKTPVSSLGVTSCELFEEEEFYDFETCYTCKEGGATTTTTAASETETTTTAASESETTTTTAAGVESTTTTTEEGSTTTTEGTTTTAEGTTTTEATTTTTEAETTTTEAATTTTTEAAPVCTNYLPVSPLPSKCGKEGKVSCRDNQKLGQATYVDSANACGKVCGTSEGCKTFSFTPKFRGTGGWCQQYSHPLAELRFTPCSTGVKFYDLDTCYKCTSEETPNPPSPPATCSAYVSTFETCSRDTICEVRGEICNEERIYNAGDSSCVENCAKSCIERGAECKYFSFQPKLFGQPAKCKLYKSGQVKKKSTSLVKFYEQKCFKCKDKLVTKKKLIV